MRGKRKLKKKMFDFYSRQTQAKFGNCFGRVEESGPAFGQSPCCFRCCCHWRGLAPPVACSRKRRRCIHGYNSSKQVLHQGFMQKIVEFRAHAHSRSSQCWVKDVRKNRCSSLLFSRTQGSLPVPHGHVTKPQRSG